jgi:PAS domain-containing protein
MDFMLLHQWAYVPARRYWTFGYQTKALARIFNAIPPRLSRSIEKMMEVLQQKYNAARGGDEAPPPSSPLSMAPYSDGGHPPPSAPVGIAAREEEMWQEEIDCGFIRLRVDPRTQHRRHVSANARAAALAGMHREELLARFAHHDVPLPFSDLDFLRFFVFFLRGEPTTCYCRFILGSPAAPRGVLVRYDTHSVYDSCGRVVEVRARARAEPPVVAPRARRASDGPAPAAAAGIASRGSRY